MLTAIGMVDMATGMVATGISFSVGISLSVQDGADWLMVVGLPCKDSIKKVDLGRTIRKLYKQCNC